MAMAISWSRANNSPIFHRFGDEVRAAAPARRGDAEGISAAVGGGYTVKDIRDGAVIIQGRSIEIVQGKGLEGEEPKASEPSLPGKVAEILQPSMLPGWNENPAGRGREGPPE